MPKLWAYIARPTALVVCALAVLGSGSAALATPAPWYLWRSKIDGVQICAQFSPGSGWERRSDSFDGPRCESRRRTVQLQ